MWYRYSDVLQPFKYAGYSLLLDAVSLPEGDDNAHFLSPERAPQLQVILHVDSKIRCRKITWFC